MRSLKAARIPAAILLALCAASVGGTFSIRKDIPGFAENAKRQAAAVNAVLNSIRANETETGIPLLTAECAADLALFGAALGEEQWWASAMQDSWGKPNSLFFEGDNYWEGSFDTCDEYKQIWEQSGIEGLPARFCNVEWWSAVYGASPSRDGIGMCLPQSCGPADFAEYVYTGAMNQTLTVPGGFPYFVPQLMEPFCVQTVEEQQQQFRNDNSAIASLCVLGVFVLLAAIGTIYDVVGMYRTEAYEERVKNMEKSGRENPGFSDADLRPNGQTSYDPHQPSGVPGEKWQPSTFGKILLAFSIMKNSLSIMNFKQPRGSIACLNGIRFLTFAWIMLGHVFQLGVFVGTNRANIGAKGRILPLIGTTDAQTLNQMNISVETFFVLSAMLTTISFLKKLAKQKPDCQMMGLYFFHRFWRLTPVYMLVVAFLAGLYPYLWRGPFFTNHPDAISCKSGWWMNLIYINNFIRTETGSCAGWTWYLANDFQFYVFAPAILFPLFYLAPLGLTLAILCGVGGLIARGVILHQEIVEQNGVDNFWAVYVKPWTRCTSYFMGMLFGYMMYKLKFKARIHPALSVLGWVLGLAAVGGSVFTAQLRGGWSGQAVVAWETLQRPFFVMGVCWIIFACSTGNGGFINSILAWDGWLPWARLSYVAYLIHPIIIYWRSFISPFQIYPTRWELIFLFLGMTLFTMGASFVVSLLFEAPFSALERVMFADLPKPKPRQAATPMVINGGNAVEIEPPVVVTTGSLDFATQANGKAMAPPPAYELKERTVSSNL